MKIAERYWIELPAHLRLERPDRYRGRKGTAEPYPDEKVRHAYKGLHAAGRQGRPVSKRQSRRIFIGSLFVYQIILALSLLLLSDPNKDARLGWPFWIWWIIIFEPIMIGIAYAQHRAGIKYER